MDTTTTKTKFSLTKHRRRTDILLLLICVTGLMLAGMTGSLLGGSTIYYDDGIRPPFAMTAIYMTAVWNAMFTILGISLSTIYRYRPTTNITTKRKLISLILFGAQTIFVLTYPLMFFRLSSHILALVWCAAIFAIMTAYMVYSAPLSKRAAFIIIPYLIWIAYCSYISIMMIL